MDDGRAGHIGSHMACDPEKHHRRSIRLRGYDYSRAGAYFVTICTQNRECLFGRVEGGGMLTNPAGRMVQGMWNHLPHRFTNAILDAFVVMPNPIHGIVVLADHRGPDDGKIDRGRKGRLVSRFS